MVPGKCGDGMNSSSPVWDVVKTLGDGSHQGWVNSLLGVEVVNRFSGKLMFKRRYIKN